MFKDLHAICIFYSLLIVADVFICVFFSSETQGQLPGDYYYT